MSLLIALASTAIIAGTFISADAQEVPVFDSEFVCDPHPQHNHSSSITEAPNGDLIVTWYRGSGERWVDDVKIMGSRKPLGSNEWHAPWVNADVPNYPDTNPITFVDPQGTLWLFWAQVLNNQWWTCVTRYRVATNYLDGPPNWDWQDDLWMVMPEQFVDDVNAGIERGRAEIPSFANENDRQKMSEMLDKRAEDVNDKLHRRLGWMPRCQPLVINGNRMLVPLYNDTFGVGLMAITEDWGKTWQVGRPIVGLSIEQPSIVQKDDGTLVAYMRDGSPHLRVHRSESTDGGFTWTPAVPTELPNPESSVAVVRLSNGHWVLALNDVDHYKGRFRLAVMLSTDEGETWSAPKYVENRPEPESGDPVEFSYPSLIQAREGLIHLTYTWRDNRYGETIRHAWFNEAWITESAE